MNRKEIIFFIAALMVLCLPFMAKPALVTHLFWLCLYRVSAVSSALLFLKASRLGVGRRLGEDTAGTDDLNSPKGCFIL